MQAGIVNFLVYENGTDYLGIAKVTLPDMTNKVLTVNGAGIPGDIDIPVPGHRDAMSVTIDFIDAPESAYVLAEQRVHVLDLRVAHENLDSTKGKLGVDAYKHILEVIPKSLKGGTLAPTAAQAVSGEYSCISRKDYINGVCVLDYQPANFIDKDGSGVDRLKDIRTALGK